MSERATGRLQLLAAALIFSAGGAGIKACELTAWQVASFRSGIAAVVVLLLMPEARRGWSWRVVVAGLPYAATVLLFVLANKLTTSANFSRCSPNWAVSTFRLSPTSLPVNFESRV